MAYVKMIFSSSMPETRKINLQGDSKISFTWRVFL